jgi:hypothetical protein
MRQHVLTHQHQLASIEARTRALSTDIQPPLLPPCPTPWAETHTQSTGTAYTSVHPGSSCAPGSFSESESEAEAESEVSRVSAQAHIREYPRRQNTARTLAAADSIYLEQDPALDHAVNQTDEGFPASILNEDVLRDPDGTPKRVHFYHFTVLFRHRNGCLGA